MILNPYRTIKLVGQWSLLASTVPLPKDEVRAMLPRGLVLGDQDLTPPGTHPVAFYFGFQGDAHMTFPRFFTKSYREALVGIPFTYRRGLLRKKTCCGPFFYMPRLLLDSALMTFGGRFGWGFEKVMARFWTLPNSYSVSSLLGDHALTSLDYEAAGEFRPALEVPTFAPQITLQDQPLIGQAPAGLGPFFECSNYNKIWSQAVVRPIKTVTRVTEPFVPGLRVGTFEAGGIDTSPLGSYELRAPWELTLPYPCACAKRA